MSRFERTYHGGTEYIIPASRAKRVLRQNDTPKPARPKIIMRNGKVLMPSRFKEISNATPPQYQQQSEGSGLLPETREF